MTTNRASDFPGSPRRGSESSVSLGFNWGHKLSLPEKELGQRGRLEFIFMRLEIVSSWETLQSTYADKWLIGVRDGLSRQMNCKISTLMTVSSDFCGEL